MNSIRTLIGVSAVLLMIHPADAGGLIQKLPKDGMWVTYHLEWKLFGPGAEDSEGTGTWTMRSVGTEMVDGKKCRWIEITEQLDAHAGEPKQERTL